MTSVARLLSLNTGRVQPLRVGERTVGSAIGKTPVAGRVAVGPLGLAGDEQADPSVHGGLDKAVYAWPAEHYPWWQARRRECGATLFDEPLPPGRAGENLTLEGLLEVELWIGDRLVFPDAVLRVTQPREPCSKFAAVMAYGQAVRDMVLSGRSGWYLAVQSPGSLAAGECARLEPGPRQVRLAEVLIGRRHKHLR